MNVLLVENESEIRSLLTTFLEIRGHQVADYEDVESGWAAYQAQSYPLVIVDCSMPGGDGLELCQKIRSSPKGYESLVLMVTARTKLGNLGQVLAAGADDYLEKPIDLHHLSIRLAIAEQRVKTMLQHAANIESLHESEQRWSIALEAGGYGVWDWKIQTGEVILSKAGKAMFGFADDEIGNNITEWEARVHPDDRPHWTEVLRALFHNKEDKFSIEYRVRCKDGSWKWMLTHGIVASRADNGLVLRMIGTHFDITAQKNTEQELQFAASVYQAIGEAVMITDSSNRIIAVNQAFTQLSGYAPSEVIGKTPNFMCSERHDEAFNRGIWHKLNTTGIWEGEIWNRHKNGEEYAVWQLIHTIYGDNGNILKRVTLFSDVTDQKRAEETIRRHAYYDLLTGLPNRRLFQDRLGLEIKKANRANLPTALLFIDLDRFKEVNDTLGHDVGDILLQEAARRISTCVRESDTVARLGGDEFTVILSDLPDIRHTDDVAQKIVTRLAEPYHIDGEIVHVSASIGIALYPKNAKGIDDLMKDADQAMYVAKSNGGNRFSHFTVSLLQAEQTRVHLINDLRVALAARQLRVYFQPIVDLSTGRIHRAEALLRWQHPTQGLVSPMEFIPLAEDTGLINEIGDWVFKESARFAKQWSRQFADDFQVSVNISPVQFKAEHNNFASEWLHHLQEMGLPGKNMVVEICEGLLLNADPGIMDKLLVLRDAGIQVAIDDFGTNYSSLSQYKKYDIDYLKIDQPFILNFTTDPNDLALSEIIVMAHKLGFKVIAEGVETEGQRDLLSAARCDYAQGNLYSRPVLPEEFDVLLQHSLNAQTQAEGCMMSETSDHSLLTEQEAAAFLQPYMPSKSAKAWLAYDRQRDPIIPLFLVQGQPYYLESDLENFVTRTLNASARLIRLNNRLYPERRNSLDRRRHGDHRPTAEGAPQHGIKRRRRGDLGLRLHANLEHRAEVGLDRRTQSNQPVH
ncbi:MAG: hypothetical protein A2143_09040 [Gallionellales bacterium RBG_16_57_15]|nr:MAG: hypothetical protein A2143_09040 [Gallionellales bacterium RBG_16_57_15]